MGLNETYEILGLIAHEMSSAMADMNPTNPMFDVLKQRVAAIRFAQAVLAERKYEE